MLPDHEILRYLESGELVIKPFEEWMLQPASVEVELGSHFMWYRTVSESQGPGKGYRDVPINPYVGVDEEKEMIRQKVTDSVVLEPGEFCLAVTEQYVEVPPWMVLQLNGKSTMGRYGTTAHITAGLIDPNFKGFITMEISNLNDIRPIELIPGMPIAQLSFIPLTSPAKRLYGDDELGSHYQNQEGVKGPRPLRSMLD